MRRLFPVLVAALTVMAIVMSSGGAYAQIAHQMQIQRNVSAEVYKLHASIDAAMQAAIDQPSFPPFVVPPYVRR